MCRQVGNRPLQKSETGAARFLFFWMKRLGKAKNKHDMSEHIKHFIHKIFSILPLLAIGIVSSSMFVLTVWASGIAPSSVIELTNRARSENGLAPLTENAKLSQAARAKANDMIKNDYFAHTSPSGRDPWYWMKQEGYAYKAAGENLAINFTDAKEQQSAWMKSKTHRANILNGNYKEIGVAVVEGKIDGESSVVTVQLFGTPPVAVADQTKPVAPPIAKEVKVPEIKGAEDTNVPIIDIPAAEPILTKTVPAASPAVAWQVPSDSIQRWFNGVWAVAVTLLVLSLLSAPSVLFFKAFRLSVSTMKGKGENTEIPKIKDKTASEQATLSSGNAV